MVGWQQCVPMIFDGVAAGLTGRKNVFLKSEF